LRIPPLSIRFARDRGNRPAFGDRNEHACTRAMRAGHENVPATQSV